MNTRRTREAALRIQLLLEEFTPDELASGLALIDPARGADLFEFLASTNSHRTSGRAPYNAIAHRSRLTVLSSLKEVEPEKYSIIREFEKSLRDGSILPTLDSCRAFGKDLSKEFDAGKSRKDCIARLIATLVPMTIDDVRAAISRVSSYTEREGAEPYRRLAAHIISGGSS